MLPNTNFKGRGQPTAAVFSLLEPTVASDPPEAGDQALTAASGLRPLDNDKADNQTLEC